MSTLRLFSLVPLAFLFACTAEPSDDVASSDSALTHVYAADFTDGTPEAAAILAVANDRTLPVDTYTKPGWDGGMYIDPVFAQAMVDRRGDADDFTSLVELNALPNARRDAFQKLFEWAKEKSPAYGYVWVPPIRKTLAAGATIRFSCAYTTWVPTRDPWGNASGGRWVDETGGGSLDAKLDGDTLTLSNKAITGDIRGSAWWAPNEWTFSLAGGAATWKSFGTTYSVRLTDTSLSLEYAYSAASAANPDAGERSSCQGGL